MGCNIYTWPVPMQLREYNNIYLIIYICIVVSHAPGHTFLYAIIHSDFTHGLRSLLCLHCRRIWNEQRHSYELCICTDLEHFDKFEHDWHFQCRESTWRSFYGRRFGRCQSESCGDAYFGLARCDMSITGMRALIHRERERDKTREENVFTHDILEWNAWRT